MKIIDAHIHFSQIGVFRDTAELYSGVDYSADGLLAECAENGIEQVIGMGVTESVLFGFPDTEASTPMPCDLPKAPPQLSVCPGITPHRLDAGSIQELECVIQDNRTAGIKIYAGYYHFHIDDAVYAPVYDLARKYKKPVVIHSGDTYSERGLLEFSHPLHVDRLAYRYRDIDFIIAHIGDPWVMDACEAAYKNRNVYVDMSGLIVGDATEVRRVMSEELLMGRFRQALLFLNDYTKVLYGSDWPLVAMAPYINFCKALLPEKEWRAVFYDNARCVFGL